MNKFSNISIGIGIAIGAAIVLSLIVIILLLSRSSSETMTLETSRGPLSVNNFINDPVERVGNTVGISRASQFSIVYFESENAFAITLLSLPLSSARSTAEENLLQQLGIAAQDACALAISVSVPYTIDDDYSGRELGLSFCPGAVPLP